MSTTDWDGDRALDGINWYVLQGMELCKVMAARAEAAGDYAVARFYERIEERVRGLSDDADEIQLSDKELIERRRWPPR